MNHQQHRIQQKSRTIDSNPKRGISVQEDEDNYNNVVPNAPPINNNPPFVHAVAVTDIEDGNMQAQQLQQMVGTSLRSDSSRGSKNNKKKSGFVEFMKKPIKIKCNNISYGCLVLTFVLFVGVFVLVETVFPEPEHESEPKKPEPFVVENKTMATTTTTIQPSSPSLSPSSSEEIPVKVLYEHIPNTYCEYYEQGGDGDCSDGLPFVDVWKKCIDDGSDKCMGVMWNSCDGPTSDTNVNGAWKLMRAGQDVGDANNPTDTCGGKNQALGHWDVFLMVSPSPSPTSIQYSYPDIVKDGDTSACGKIQVKATGKFLHLDGNGDKLLSTRYQPNDDYTKFMLEKQDDDASYRIKVKADSSYLHEDGATNGDKLLSTRYQPNDDYTKFLLEYQDDDASYKIRVKANGRYWHEDGGTTELVSTLWQPDDDFVRFNLLPCETTTTTIPIQDYKVIEDGTCKSNGMLPIYDKETCIDATSALGYSIEWGPHGGYQDVVDGCSIRFGAHLFLNSEEGTCDPEHGIGGWTHTGCRCADWMPCFCEKISYQHIPNTYCEYYEQGGTEDCATGDSFVDVWKKCIDDGSDKCMGVMWNSCDGPTSDTSVNGAWKLMKAGQDVGDANNPTATCGGKRQALGHWDVFLV